MTPRSADRGLTRRQALRTGGLALAGLAGGLMPAAGRAAPVAQIHMRSVNNGGHVWFDPVGLHVAPGTVVRWVVEADVHTTTAYHPANENHPLRIPKEAAPWDSDYLVNPGDAFEVTLMVDGVYDYFCTPHEMAGMVGRIVVGRPGGPGAQPFDYFQGDPAAAGWSRVPDAARAVFPSVEEIMARKIVPAG